MVYKNGSYGCTWIYPDICRSQSAHGDIFLPSLLLGRKDDCGHSSSSISGVQLGRMSCCRQMPRTTRRFVTSSILADVAKEFMNFHAPRIIKPEADPKTVASIILGGGAGTRLVPLTRPRAKPAVSQF